MKIVTVTVHHAHNYGAMLQAYGLQRALVELGCKTEIIDYDEINSRLFPRIECSGLRKTLSSIYYWTKTVFFYVPYKKAFERFEEFYRNELLKTPKFDSIQDINISGCSLILAGSDQIWNLKRGRNRPFFQLDFAANIIKASYAASMGGHFCLAPQVRENFKRSLSQFNFYSVREKETRDYLVGMLGNIECHVNIDPVFLLSKNTWTDLAAKAKNYDIHGKYILCYELLPSAAMNRCVTELKNKTGFKTVILAANVYSRQKGDKIIRDAGPLEMLSLIHNAAYVVTTSFHGTAFAVLLHRPFYSVLTGHGPGRIIELLRNMGLEDRIYQDDTFTIKKCDFSAADQYIDKQKRDAISYLEKLKEAAECVG